MKPILTPERLRVVLNYDAQTGVFTWAKSLSPVAPAGSVAGSVQSEGDIHIGIDRVYYKAHHLAWLYVTGLWPSSEIDHANMERTDNRFANLRLATNQQQAANRAVLRNNRLGVKGVGLSYKPKHVSSRYRARIRVNNKLIHLGYYPTPEAANAAYGEAARQHFGEFARRA